MNQPVQSVSYTVTGAATVSVSGLPSGVSGQLTNNTFTISGQTGSVGTFFYTVNLVGGCTAGTNSASGVLIVLGNSASTLNDTICEGQSYSFGNQSLNNAGVYTRTIPSFNGCDSVITLNLFVKPYNSISYISGTTTNTTGTITVTQSPVVGGGIFGRPWV